MPLFFLNWIKIDRLEYNFSVRRKRLMKPKISTYDIQALIDGELDQEDAKCVKLEIEKNPHLRQLYEDLVFQKTMLQEWWKGLH